MKYTSPFNPGAEEEVRRLGHPFSGLARVWLITQSFPSERSSQTNPDIQTFAQSLTGNAVVRRRIGRDTKLGLSQENVGRCRWRSVRERHGVVPGPRDRIAQVFAEFWRDYAQV
jgi:hypothetical protein